MSTETNLIVFTAGQLKDWKSYEKARKSGRYNMFDPRARSATKLSEERYRFAMKNYAKLKAATEADSGKAHTEGVK